MKVHKRTCTDAGKPRKQLTTTISKQTNRYVNRPKTIKNNRNKYKLYSLRHQSLDILRKSEKFKLKERKSQYNSLNKLIDDTSQENRNSNHFNSKIHFRKNIANKRKDSDSETFSSVEALKPIKYKKAFSDSSVSKDKYNKSEKSSGSSDNNIKEACTSETFATRKICNMLNSTNISKGKKVSKRKDVYNNVDVTDTSTDDIKCDENVDFHKNVKKSTHRKKRDKFHIRIEDCNKLEAAVNSDDDLSKPPYGSSGSSSCSNAGYNERLSIDHIEEDRESTQRVKNIEPVRNIENFPCMVFHKFSKTQVLLTLVHPCSLYFIGVLEIEVLVGSVKVLGYLLDNLSGKQTLYSPQGVSHLSITTEYNGKLDETSISKLKEIGVDEDKINNIREKFCDDVVMIVVNKDETDLTSVVWPAFVEKYTDVCLLPLKYRKSPTNEVEKALQCEFHLYSRSAKLFCEIPEWKSILDSINVSDTSRTILCGGKGVGKSTLLRYLVNQSLNSYKKVLVLDFDPGQSEFTISGCISASVVSSPLLGPNFSHLLTPVRSLFFGEITVVNSLKYYFVCAQDIINFCNSSDELNSIPWLINTMGYNKGIGMLITASIIKKVSPTALVQIESKLKSRNFKSKLTPEFVEENILNLSRSSSDSVPNYNVFVIPSAVQRKLAENCGIAAPSLRNIMVLSYFGQMLDCNMKDFYSVEPFIVNLSDINITVINANLTGNALLDAVNGGLVALCYRSSEKYSLNICFGFGIVRAVNKDTQQLFLLTPLAEDKLNQVNSLVKGSIDLPKKLYTNPSKNVNGFVPYVSLTNNTFSRV